MKFITILACMLYLLAAASGCGNPSPVAYKVAYRDNAGLECRVSGDTLIMRSQKGYQLLRIRDGRTIFQYPNKDPLSIGGVSANGTKRYNFDVIGKGLFWMDTHPFDASIGAVHRLDLESLQHHMLGRASSGYRIFPVDERDETILVADHQRICMLDSKQNQILWEKNMAAPYTIINAVSSTAGIVVGGSGVDSIYVLSPLNGTSKAVYHFAYPTSTGVPPHLLIDETGQLIAASARGVQQIDLVTGIHKWSYPAEGKIDRVFLAPDGDAILVMQNAAIIRLDGTTGKPIQRTDAYACREKQLSLASIDHAGKQIVLAVHCDTRSGIAVVDALSLKEIRFFPCATSSNFEPIVQNGLVIYYLDQEASLIAWKIGGRERLLLSDRLVSIRTTTPPNR